MRKQNVRTQRNNIPLRERDHPFELRVLEVELVQLGRGGEFEELIHMFL